MIDLSISLAHYSLGNNARYKVGNNLRPTSVTKVIMLLKKDHVKGRKSNFARRGGDFRSASVLSRGLPLSRFTHFRSLQGLSCDAKSPRSDAGSTPINHLAKVSFPSLSYEPSRSKSLFICLMRERIAPYFQSEEVMSDNTLHKE